MSLDSHIETITQTSSEAKHLKATHTKSLNTIKKESQNRDSSAKQHTPSHKEKSHTVLYNNDSHTQSNIQHHSTQDSHTLSQFHKDFIEWYIHSRDIRNKDYYRKLLAKQIQENTFKDYEKHIQDYKFHLYMLQKQRERREGQYKGR